VGDLIAVFFIGVLGVVHCAAMCGGLMTACAMRFGGKGLRPTIGFSLIYNLARISTYAAFGLVMGVLGKALMKIGLLTEFQTMMPFIAGAVMVLIGIDLLGLMPKRLKKYTSRLFPARLLGRVSRVGGSRKYLSAAIMGLVNGLIPCGMVYAVGAKAAATGEPLSAVLIMAAFGLGTFLPLVFGVALAKGLAGVKTAGFTYVTSLIIIVLGVKTMYMSFMGMGMKM